MDAQRMGRMALTGRDERGQPVMFEITQTESGGYELCITRGVGTRVQVTVIHILGEQTDGVAA